MRLALFILLFVINLSAFAQKENYFQQKLYYKIDARLNIINNTISADYSLIYKNNSADTLNFIIIHLYPNAYSTDTSSLSEQLLRLGETAFYYSNKEEKGYIDSLSFTQDGHSLYYEFYQNNIDVIKLILHKAVKPNDSIKIQTPFKVKFPSYKFSRLGVYEDGAKKSFQITQWYPKPAVYDKDGWHPMPYLHLGEYYSEFAEYDITISVPESFQIASSGKLLSSTGIGNDFVKYSYKESDIHDFAIFTGNVYKMRYDYIKLPYSNKKVRINIFYRSKSWELAMDYAKRGIKFYSEMLGDYPYDELSVVQAPIIAGAGMEYPKITAININTIGPTLDKVIIHEIGHNWFYGILAFNERDFPWLDEGLNSYLQYLYELKYYPELSLADDYFAGLKIFGSQNISANEFYKMSHLFVASRKIDQKINLKSDEYSIANYGFSPYFKTIIGFNYLNSYLQNNELNKLIKTFYHKFKFTHPHQDDFINFIKQSASKNTTWFFDKYLNSRGVIDFSIGRIKKINDSIKVNVIDNYKSQYPFRISSLNSDNEIIEDKWILAKEKTTQVVFKSDGVYKIVIDKDNDIPDINIDNNHKKISGLIKQRKLPHFHFIANVSDYNKKNLFITPAMAINTNNGFMAGMGFYNDLLIDRNWQYYAFPLYSFKSNDVNGVFNIERKIINSNNKAKVLAGFNFKTFAYDFEQYANTNYPLSYIKYRPYLRFNFNYPGDKPYKSSGFELSLNYIDKEIIDYQSLILLSENYKTEYLSYMFANINYEYKNDREINPFNFNINALFDFQMYQFDFEANYRLNYKKANRYLDIRFYAAKQFHTSVFLFYNPQNQIDYSLKMSSWSGADDFLFEKTYYNRNGDLGNRIFDNQMYVKGGGFIIPTFLGNNYNYLAALNLKSTLPMTKYIKVFANFGTYPYQQINMDEAVLYEAGFMLSIIDKHLEVYFPVVWSKEIKDVQKLNGIDAYKNNIRFVVNFDELNIFDKLRRIQL